MASLSVVIATFNEEENISQCLQSVKEIADEIIVVDGTSTDNTVKIAKEFGAQVEVTTNPPIFHINKQKGIDQATKEWILQLDADERISRQLANEIKKVISLSNSEIREYEETLPNKSLFLRHQRILEERDGHIGTSIQDEYTAFFLPRKNYFLGKYLRYGGVYPDGVIRLFKRGKAYLPARDVHEQFVVEGQVGWLHNDLLHMDSPTFEKYIKRWKRYTTLIAKEYKKERVGQSPVMFIKYIFVLPIWWFLLTFIRHKGFMDGWPGFVFSFFSSLRFPVSFIKYLNL